MERRSFTREFKLEAVKLLKKRGVGEAQPSRDLGVHGNMLRKPCHPELETYLTAWTKAAGLAATKGAIIPQHRKG